jgi:hypothetical protein
VIVVGADDNFGIRVPNVVIDHHKAGGPNLFFGDDKVGRR